MKPVVFIALITLCGSVFSEESSTTEQKLGELSDALSGAPKFAMDVHFTEDKNVAVFNYDVAKDSKLLHRDSDDEKDLSLNALRQMLREAFTTKEQPGLKCVFHIPNVPDVAAYPKGLPETTYALRFLLSKKDFAAWIDTHVAPPLDACPIRAGEEHFQNVLCADATKIKTHTPESENALKFAKAIYDQRRAELIARFNHSYLFYAAANKSAWTTFRKNKTWYVQTHCADLMFYAVFVFQLELTGNESLQCTQIHAGEFFKGE